MKSRSSAFGFTLMELILVIVLLSLLSFFAASRFIAKGSFSAYALQEQVISVVRQVQVNRMQSNIDLPDKPYPERCDPNVYAEGEDDSYPNFCLSLTSSCIGSSAFCTLDSHERSARSDGVLDGSARFSLMNGATGPVEFDLLGNPIGKNSDGVSILIEDRNGQSRCLVAINSQGYVSKGTCS